MPIRLILADDHPLILDGLETLFRLEEGIEVVARCADGLSALDTVRRHQPDILILDIRMPGKGGLDVARQLKAEGVPTRVVLFTAALDDDELVEAVCVGVQGIVLKEMAPQFLVQCIRKVADGGQWIERRSAGLALEALLRREAGGREVGALLTPRELDLVRMVARGLRNREVADNLCISEGTVKVHLHNIYEKLGVKGRVALLRYAQEKGIA